MISNVKGVTLALGCLFPGLVVLIACSSSSKSTESADASAASDAGASDGAPPADCVDECAEQFNACSQDDTPCKQICATVNATQFACIKAAGCDQAKITACQKTATGPAVGPCVAVGQSGCSTTAASGCCLDATRPDVACNANNDGKGNAQCCVKSGNPCANTTDCCGSVSNPAIKCCPTGKCGSGC